MARVYSYLRFSDPRQGGGDSAARQTEYAERWAAERGRVLDESLSLRDEGLSAYHQRHVTQGALGVFLRAIEDGQIAPGSVLIVEGLDRLSRAEPIQAQAQLAQIINAGITVVTASDGREYNRERLKAQPMDLVYSLLVMIRAHEESDTKSKRVKAAIRRLCEGWQAGTWRGPIRQGHDPQWVRWTDSGWELIPERVAALRVAVDLYLAGHGAVQIGRQLQARGLVLTNGGNLTNLYKTLRNPTLIGHREIDLDGEVYRLEGYYPAVLTPAEFDGLRMAMNLRQGRRGVGEIPSLITGMGIAVCGYCGRAIVNQNLMQRRRKDGSFSPGHRRLFCTGYQSQGGCTVPGSMQAGAVERALMIYCADQMRLDGLMGGGQQIQGLRAELTAARARLAETEAKLDRMGRHLAIDDGPAPITVLRQMREMETAATTERNRIGDMEREITATRATPAPGLAARWLSLIDGVEAMDVESRMQARELVRTSFTRITIWHTGDPTGAEGGQVIDLEIVARGGGSTRLRIDRYSGGLVD